LRKEIAVKHAIRGLLLLAAVVGASQALADGKAYVGNFKDNTVSVVDVAGGAVVATVRVADGPHGMAVSRDGRTVYVTGENSSSMSVIDTATDKVVATVDVGKSPHGLAWLPDGRTQLVGVYGEDKVAMFDTGARKVVAEMPVAKPHTIAVRGNFAYVASQQPGAFALVVLDLDKRAVAKSIALDKPPRDLEFAADGTSLYFT
jgi:YVTN family beta-propeller protein